MTNIEWAYWALLAAPAVMVLGLNVINAMFWTRGRPRGKREFTVLIPARNEEASIERCVRSVAESELKPKQIVVYDDGSTDKTPEILSSLQSDIPFLEVVQGNGLPDGWVGKPHACHQLASHAESGTLLFLDADVELQPEGLSRIAGLFEDYDASVVTAMPRQRVESFAERLVLPLLHLTYTSWLLLPLIWRTNDPRFLAANGQVLAVTRETYDAIGGFEAVKSEVVDDMAFCRNAKSNKRRVVFADGHHIAVCRMYENAAGVWEGFSKNLYEGVGANPIALVAVLMLYLGTFIAPIAGLIASIWLPELLLPAAVGTVSVLAIRTLLMVRHGHPFIESILLHPLAILAFVSIAINSFIWNVKGAIHWSGRSYAPKKARNNG